MKKFQIVQEETFNPIADTFDSYEEAIAQIEEYEKEDKEEGNFVEGYYSIIEIEERDRNRVIEEIKDICYDNEIFYINTRDKEFFKPYDLMEYKDYRKSKINGFILYHRGGLPPRLVDLIKEVEKNEK